MIQFNTDGYVCAEKGKIPTPLTYTKQGISTIKKKWQAAWNDRLEILAKIVAYWTKNRIDKLIASCFAKD